MKVQRFMTARALSSDELAAMAADPDLLVSVECNGGRYRASIGHRHHGYTCHHTWSTYDTAVRWLRTQAQRLFPMSAYAQRSEAVVHPTMVP